MANISDIKALVAEATGIFEKIKETAGDDFDTTANELISVLKGMKLKQDLSQNIAEDMEPVSDKDISTGLRNY